MQLVRLIVPRRMDSFLWEWFLAAVTLKIRGQALPPHPVLFELWTLESGISRLRGHLEGPETLSAVCVTIESEVIVEVPLATPTV